MYMIHRYQGSGRREKCTSTEAWEEKGAVQKERVTKVFSKLLEGKELASATQSNVVDFLIFKEMEGKQRTKSTGKIVGL